MTKTSVAKSLSYLTGVAMFKMSPIVLETVCMNMNAVSTQAKLKPSLILHMIRVIVGFSSIAVLCKSSL